jgi:hypothetical protein
MSDEQKKSDGGWEWELKQAEAAIAVAPGGSPELARGVYLQAQAIRNMFMGDIGQSYVNSLENAVGRAIGAAIAPLVEGQKETHSGIAALSVLFHTLAEAVDQLERDAEALKQGQIDYNKRLDSVVTRLDHKRERLDILEAQVREMRGDYSPEQRQRYINILMQMIAEWERTHPDMVD